MTRENLSCPACGQLAAWMKETSGGSYRQYDQLLQELMKLEGRGVIELFAGDCPLGIPTRCWHPNGTTPSVTICGAAAAGLFILWGPASGESRSGGR